MKVDLTTKVLCLKASAHFLIISNLYFLLTIVITGATIYAYFYCPKDMFGLPLPDEKLKVLKEDAIMKGLGGITVIPFFVLSAITGFMSCFKNKEWFGLCAIISVVLAFIFLGYDMYILLYLKLKYVWPPQLLVDVQAETPPGQPFTNEDVLINFTKVLISAITFSMFAVVSILLYCSFLLANLSFLYKTPKPIPPRRRRAAPIRNREEEEEDDETGGDENEAEEKESKSKKDKVIKEKSKKGEVKEVEKKDDKEKEKEVDQTGTGTGTGTQTGTGIE